MRNPQNRSPQDRHQDRAAEAAWTLDLPAGLLHVWPRGEAAEWEERLGALVQAVGAEGGVHRLDAHRLAVVPVAGDPAVLDAAASYGRLLAAAAQRPLAGGSAGAALLVTPGRVRLSAAGVHALHDPLLADLAARPPKLPPTGVHLTGRAARVLETRREVYSAGSYEGPGGHSVTLFLAGARKPSERPWRNPEILGRRLTALARPAPARAVREAAAAGAVRVFGALGVGKTRLAVESIGEGSDAPRVTPAPGRAHSPSLAEQIAFAWLPHLSGAEREEVEDLVRRLAAARRARLLGHGDAALERVAAERLAARLPQVVAVCAAARRGPRALLFDDLESAGEADFALIAALLEARAATGRGSPALILIGRSGTPWPAALRKLPAVEVPAFTASEIAEFAGQLLSGLSLPPPVEQRLIEGAAGNPFVLEEGVAAMIHRRSLRRFYGSFFFSGGDDTAYEPSPRLILHAEAEARRLGEPAPLRLLAVAQDPAPADELRSAAAMAGGPRAAAGWERAFAERGWLVPRPTPWGEGVALASPALVAALAATLAPETALAARRALGSLLAELSREPAARWAAYRLLAGGEGAAAALLDVATRAAAADERPPVGDDEILAALIRELVAHRETDGDGETELALLLALLPLALRTAHLEGLADELKHAMHLALEQGGGGPERLLALARLKADLDRREGRLAKAEQTLRKALEKSHHVDERGKAALLLQLGRVLIARQRLDEAERLFGQVLERVGAPGSEDLAASCRFFLGNVALQRCRYEEALAHHQAALDLRRGGPGPAKPRIASLTAVGAALLALGHYAESLAHYQEAEELAQETGDDEELSYVLIGIANALSRLGDFAAASAPLRQALAVREGSGDGLGEAVARLAVAENHLALDRPREALAEAREAHFQLSLLTEGRPLGQAERLLGRIQLVRRKPGEARNYLVRALRYHEERGDAAEAAFDRAWLLDAAIAEERLEEVMLLTRDLAGFLAGSDYPELGERIDLRMYRGLDWLRGRGEEAGDPAQHLARAYRGLLAKAERLRPDQRQVFLYQVPDHEAIVVAATRAGLAR